MPNETFSTGAQRDTLKGKLRYDLMSPLVAFRKAIIFTEGAEKYGDRNWEKGIPIMRTLSSMLRHQYLYLMGDTSEDHAGKMAWNADAIVHYDEAIKRGLLPRSLDDRPKYVQPEIKATVAELTAMLSPGKTYTTAPDKVERPKYAVPDKAQVEARKMGRIYVSGPMRGKADYNYPAFDSAKQYLRTMGWDVVSPADIDRTLGFCESVKDYAKRDAAAVLDCDAVFMLKGWKNSIGARAEHALASFAELELHYQEGAE